MRTAIRSAIFSSSRLRHRLRQCVRDADIVARLGGDEFAIVQAGNSQPTDATSLASRLIEVDRRTV